MVGIDSYVQFVRISSRIWETREGRQQVMVNQVSKYLLVGIL